MEYQHIPVMLNDVLAGLEPKPGQVFIDCTLGGAGYTLALAKAVGPKGKVLAIDLDDLALENARKKIKLAGISNIVLVQDNFRNLQNIVKNSSFDCYNNIYIFYIFKCIYA
jgi:16S rRNA (cytosine1402-N4)-methyltransferase